MIEDRWFENVDHELKDQVRQPGRYRVKRKLTNFELGVVYACVNINNNFDQPTMCAEALNTININQDNYESIENLDDTEKEGILKVLEINQEV